MRTKATHLFYVIAICFVLTLTRSTNADGDQPFTITPLVLEGDEIPGIAAVDSIEHLAINNNGDWMVHARTFYDNCETVLIRNDQVLLWQCQPLDEPEGATLDNIDSVNINNFGNSGLNLGLDVGSLQAVGIYLNTDLLILTNDISTADGFTPGTIYSEFFATKINNNNPQQILLNAEVDDPNIPGEDDRALVLVALKADGPGHTETLVFKEGDILPGQTAPILMFDKLWDTQFDLNDAGDVMFVARLDEVGWPRVVYIGDLLVAQQDGRSPIKGRNWDGLGASVSLNNNREHALIGRLDGDPKTASLIAKNGKKLVQEGDIIAGANDAPINLSVLAPLAINDNGQVVWFGSWEGPDGKDEVSGLFLDLSLVVRSGVPTKEGFVFDSIAPSTINSFDMSNDGRYIIFQAYLDDGTDGAFLIDFGAPCPWDLDGDQTVGAVDLLSLLTAWGPCKGCPADFDDNDSVGASDLLALLVNWGPCP